MKNIFFLLLSLGCFSSCIKEGCTDPDAGNYDKDAVTDDGSCSYAVERFVGTLFVDQSSYYDDCYDLFGEDIYHKTIYIFPNTRKSPEEVYFTVRNNFYSGSGYVERLDTFLTGQIINDRLIIPSQLIAVYSYMNEETYYTVQGSASDLDHIPLTFDIKKINSVTGAVISTQQGYCQLRLQRN